MPKEIDDVLATALKAARRGKAFRFAFIPKGQSGKLLLGKAIPPATIAEAKTEIGGSTVIRGRCFGENSTLCFEVSKDVGQTVPLQIKRAIKSDAAMTVDCLVRVKGKDKEEETETESDEAVDLLRRFNEMSRVIDAAAAGSGSDPARIQSLADAFDDYMADAEYSQAKRTLEDLSALLKKPAASSAAPTASASRDASQAVLIARLHAVAEDYQNAISQKLPEAAQLQEQFKKLRQLVDEKHFDEALTMLPAFEAGVAKAALSIKTASAGKVKSKADKTPNQPTSRPDPQQQAEAAKNLEQQLAARLGSSIVRSSKTLEYAKSQSPDEAIRILGDVKSRLARERHIFEKAYPNSKVKPARPMTAEQLLAEIEKTSKVLEKQAFERVSERCKERLRLFSESLEAGGLNTQNKGSFSRQEAQKIAAELLHRINEVEEGVRLDGEMLKRIGVTSLDPALKKISDLLAVPKNNLAALIPGRTTSKAPEKAPDVNRPSPKGVGDPTAWNKACDEVDRAIAKGEAPRPEDLAKMRDGAKQALKAEERWNWEADLVGKWGAQWNNIKAEYKRLLKEKPDLAKEFMSGYWWFRKVVVDEEMQSLADKYGFVWESVGSTNLESDYDISIRSHGTKNGSPRDWDLVQMFNKAIASRFGKQSGSVFDTNLYAEAPPPELKTYEQKTQTERDMDAMSEAGQDVGALMKMRRYMSWEDYSEFQAETLAELQKAFRAEENPEKKKIIARRLDIARRQFEEADDLYFMSLRNILEKAKVSIPERAIADTIEGQKMLIQLVEKLEQDPDKLLAATNDLYLDRMKQVRNVEADFRKLEGKDDDESRAKRAALLAKLKTFQTDAVFFAAEAYHSEGPFKHIVQANQKSAQEVKAAGLTGDAAKAETAKKVNEKLNKLSLNGFLQSFNEQLGDFLKDVQHYEHKSPFPGLGFYRSSKYLERLCDSMVWIAEKLKGSPAYDEFVAIKIAGQDPKTVKGKLGSLVEVRGGKVEFTGVSDPEAEAEAYSMEQAQAIFGSNVKTLRDLATLIKNVGKRVNAVLRKAQAGQAMTAESEKAYFSSGTNVQ